jgi:hypothetical protein
MKRLLLAALLLLLAASASAQGQGTWVVGEGKSASCLAGTSAARADATLAATNDAYARCTAANDDWILVARFQLPGNETRGNPRDFVRCTPCAGKSGPGFQCTVRLLPQLCQQDGQPVASNADWNAPDRTREPAAAIPPGLQPPAEARGRRPAPSGVQAGDAAGCVAVSQAGNAQTLTNKCPDPIVVFWCVHSDGPRLGVAGCGANGNHYQHTATLPGKGSTSDPLTLPPDTSLDVDACFRGAGSQGRAGGTGADFCRTAKAGIVPEATTTTGKSGPETDTVPMVATSSGRSEEEACMRARIVGMEHGTPSACSCRLRGPVHVCQVQTSGPKPAHSVWRALRAEFMKRFGCRPELEKCAFPKNVGTGVRG